MDALCRLVWDEPWVVIIADNGSIDATRVRGGTIWQGLGRGRAGHEIGDAATRIEQQLFITRVQNALGESRSRKRRPEAVARPRKVVAGRTGVQTGIDPAEQDA